MFSLGEDYFFKDPAVFIEAKDTPWLSQNLFKDYKSPKDWKKVLIGMDIRYDNFLLTKVFERNEITKALDSLPEAFYKKTFGSSDLYLVILTREAIEVIKCLND